MCVTKELLHAKRRIKELEAQLVEPPKPEIRFIAQTGLETKDDIAPFSLKMMYPGLIDTAYFYTDAEGWAEVFDYVYFRYPMPKYIANRFDCDDFAMLMKGMVAGLFQLNYFAVIFGDSPMGYHAFNCFKTPDGLMLFEPQTGEMFPIEEAKYIPEYILL